MLEDYDQTTFSLPRFTWNSKMIKWQVLNSHKDQEVIVKNFIAFLKINNENLF